MLDAVTTISSLTQSVDNLASLGVKPPKEWAQLGARWSEFTGLDYGHAVGELADAVTAGTDPTQLMQLAATAGLSADPRARAELNQSVAQRIFPKFRHLSADYGTKAHEQLRTRFNAAAARFTAAASVAAPDLDPEAVLRADEDTRHAYLERADLLPELVALANGLRDAALLAGHILANDEGAHLIIDFDKVAPRDNYRVWTAYTRGAVDWLALARLGALGARPLPVPGARRHPGLEARAVRGGIGYGRRLWDPVADDWHEG